MVLRRPASCLPEKSNVESKHNISPLSNQPPTDVEEEHRRNVIDILGFHDFFRLLANSVTAFQVDQRDTVKRFLGGHVFAWFSFSVCFLYNSSSYTLQDGGKVEGAVGKSLPSVVQPLSPGLNHHLQLQLVVTTL